MSDAQRTGLLIVDLQNDFLAPEGAYARGGAVSPAALALPARVAPVAQAVKAAGGLVVACQFTLWPDAQGEPMIAPHLKALRPFLRRGDFQQGAWGHQHVDAILPWVDVSVSKVAYSAFFNTQLDWVLRHAGVETLAICGIVTNGGVASSLRDAHMREYHTVVLSDGCAAFKTTTHEASLADMGTISEVMTCEAFTRQLSAQH
ncbi:MAG: cysteine hydrolase [Limnohabitans sp.]|jgi:ureidoacrylate peracid hydrolase|nr:cysteine hydrolase [Limnohabitans sp.]